MTAHIIDVRGIPAPQGSKRHVGNGRMIESSRRVGPWREAVRHTTAAAPIDTIATGPVAIAIVFRLPRPKGHHGARGLRPSAPRLPAVLPDLDKLTRAVLDGLVSGGALADDRQVTTLYVRKVYADGVPPGATITLASDGEDPR